MKKLLSLLLALCLLVACGAAGAEAVDLTGAWYGDLFGMSMNLNLVADGTYTMELMGETDNGTWAQTETGLTLDDGALTLTYDAAANTLGMEIEGIPLVFSREAAAAVGPAEVDTAAVLEDFAGTWSADRVDFMGLVMPIAEMGMGMELVIEEANVTVNMIEGETVESVVCAGTFENAELTIALPAEAEEEPQTFVIRRLVDGTVSCTTVLMELPMTFYLQPVVAAE